MNVSEIISVTIVLASVFAYINHRFIKWSPTIGIMVLSLISSILVAVFGHLIPSVSTKVIQLASAIDFEDVLMNFMLSFLLFAGAIHLEVHKLKKERVPVVLLSTLGTFISTIIVGGASWWLFSVFHLNIPFIYCLLFGALISPTDPIAVLAILKDAKIPSTLELKISGESLFNDGVAVVLFVSIAEVAKLGADSFSFNAMIRLFVQEAIGGVLFGALLGYVSYLALRPIDNYKVEVLITLAMVMGGYTLAGYLHVSGPLAMVVAGLIVGSKVKDEAMSATTQDYLVKFWELVDEILNAVLFMLIGLEMLVIKINGTIFTIGLLVVLVVLAARWISVIIPVNVLRYWITFEKNAVAILTWGGLRGGLSVALALSLPVAMHRDEFVLITYIVVVFSILVQGLTIGKVARKLAGKPVAVPAAD